MFHNSAKVLIRIKIWPLLTTLHSATNAQQFYSLFCFLFLLLRLCADELWARVLTHGSIPLQSHGLHCYQSSHWIIDCGAKFHASPRKTRVGCRVSSNIIWSLVLSHICFWKLLTVGGATLLLAGLLRCWDDRERLLLCVFVIWCRHRSGFIHNCTGTELK